MIRARLSLLVAAVLAALAVLPGCIPTAPPPLRVELWGDSIGAQAAPYFNLFLSATHRVNPRTHVFAGSGLCDMLPDIRRELDPANPSGFHPQVMILEFAGVPFTQCVHDAKGAQLGGQALIDRYHADALTAISLARAAHVPIYFASVPLYREEAAAGYVGDGPMGRMYSRLPAAFPGGQVRFIDSALAVEWHGHYTVTMPAMPWETPTGRWPDGTPTVVVRETDGRHFCPVPEIGFPPVCLVPMPGAFRYAAAIVGRIEADYGIH